MNGKERMPLPNPKKARLSTASSPMEVYKCLKNKYLEQKMADDGKWPRLPAKKYINLVVIWWSSKESSLLQK